MPKPNFTGTWKFNPAKSVLQITQPDETIIVIDHQEPFFRITRTHKVDKKSDSFTVELTTDGKKISIDQPEVRLRARAYWDDDALVFDSDLVRGSEAATNVVRYSFGEDLNSIVAEEQYQSKNLNYKNVWVLDKQ